MVNLVLKCNFCSSGGMISLYYSEASQTRTGECSYNAYFEDYFINIIPYFWSLCMRSFPYYYSLLLSLFMLFISLKHGYFVIVYLSNTQKLFKKWTQHVHGSGFYCLWNSNLYNLDLMISAPFSVLIVYLFTCFCINMDKRNIMTCINKQIFNVVGLTFHQFTANACNIYVTAQSVFDFKLHHYL